jgi:hypothetical protein
MGALPPLDAWGIYRTGKPIEGTTRILLDTNVWRALADANAGQRLSSAAERRGLAIAVAPSVVYETLRLEDVALGNRILRIQTSRRWARLMPEAFSECAEILTEVRRLHPTWLAPAPDLSGYERHLRDWTRGMAKSKSLAGLGFWNRVREHPDWMANAVRSDRRLEAARIESKAAQVERRLRAAGPPSLKGLCARLPDQPSGSEVEAWRWPAFFAFASHVQDDSSPYRDWLTPWFRIDPRDMGSDPWTLFWAYQCDTPAVPRQWLRWAFSYYQTFVKWTPGTPGDEQLGTYLLDCRHVVSADKVFVRLVREIGGQSPIAMPAAHLVRGGVDGAADLVELVGQLDSTTPIEGPPRPPSTAACIEMGGVTP